MEKKKFTSSLDVLVEHDNSVIVGSLEYELPSQFERLELARMYTEGNLEDEDKRDIGLASKIYAILYPKLLECDLKVYEKDKRAKNLDFYTDSKKDRKLVDAIKDVDALQYYACMDVIMPQLAVAYGRGLEVGKPLKQK